MALFVVTVTYVEIPAHTHAALVTGFVSAGSIEPQLAAAMLYHSEAGKLADEQDAEAKHADRAEIGICDISPTTVLVRDQTITVGDVGSRPGPR